MSGHHQPRPFQIFNISAEIADRKVTEVYVVFSVKGANLEKQKSPTVSGTDGDFIWEEGFIDIEIPDPTTAVLEVKAYQRRSVISDRLLGEFSLTLAHPGATANLSGDLAKKGSSNGTVSFKIRPKSGRASARHGEVVTNRDSAYPSSQTLQKLPSKGNTVTERHLAERAKEKAGATSDEAGARSNPVAAEADRRSNQVTQQPEGKTMATVNATEAKLQDFKQDMAEGAQRPHHHSHESPAAESQGLGSPPGTSTGQGAFSRTVGVPPEAGTANDEAGAGATQGAPYEADLGGASGAVAGPVAPTGHGGVFASTGASTTGTENSGTVGQQVRGAAASAADKAHGALDHAKQGFSSS